MSNYILAIDQGTSSSRTLIFDAAAQVVGTAQQEFPQIYPRPGWVEHDPEAIWSSVTAVTREALSSAGLAAGDIAGIGITNQRETTLVWDRTSGKCIYNAIVWQDRRTAKRCRELQASGAEAKVSAATGLRLDPYFSATKIAWILDNVEGARDKAARGELAFGTVDTYLLWRLTGGAEHLTDATNASRTLLYNIHTGAWDADMLALFDVPASMLPEVRDCAADFGTTDAGLVGAPIPIGGVAGDQQAALIGQAAFAPGMTKSTYGTGCFVVANTGSEALTSGNQLLTTIGYRLEGKTTYALEGSIFIAGAAMQWLRDELRVIDSAPESEGIAVAQGVVDDVYVVPAFTGLGAPYWDPDARGAVLGLSRDSGREAIVTATLQSVAYQTRDLLDAMRDDGLDLSVIRVDGGMVANNWFLQFLADTLGLTVERPANVESTVTGAAFLAGLQCGVYDSLASVASGWASERRFDCSMPDDRRAALYDGWRDAVRRVRSA